MRSQSIGMRKQLSCRSLRFRKWCGPLLALAGAALLGACSSLPQMGDITSVFRGTPETPAAAVPQPAPAAAPEPADYATSSVIHPEIWPLSAPAVARDPAIEAEVARLLAQMTLEEKVGQILQPDIGTTTPDEVRLYHLGSILNAGDVGPYGHLRGPASEWLKAADEYYSASIDVPPGQPAIPVIWGLDAMHGHAHVIGATIFPHNIGLGAMRDPDLVRRIGEITAQEIRVTGQDWTFAPTIAVVRDDRWGRTYEGYSEDPKIVTEYAAAMVEGLQGRPGDPDFLKDGHVIASIKHYIGDGGTNLGANMGDNRYSEPAFRDIFGLPYEAAVKAGAQTVMVSYSSWRGANMHAGKALANDVLFGRMGFDGFVVSDYNGFAMVPGCTQVRCAASFNAGVDMYMTEQGWKVLYGNLVNDVSSGAIPMARLDEAVARILRVKLRAGAMTAGKPSTRKYAGQWELLGSPDHRAVARQAVRESLVLLKNDGGLLPLSPRARVLVAGDGADDMSKQTGGWTISWQGTGNGRADFPNATTIFEGIKAKVEAAGGTATLSVEGSFKDKPDVAVVVFGEAPYAEGAGDLRDVDYQQGDRRDLKLLQRFRAQGIPVVAVFLSGRPLYVTPEINASNAFVAAWLPGSEGEGIADVLFGKPDGSVAYDFHGKLSYSWPKRPDQTPLNVGTEPYDPLFAYGYGLTYGTPRNIGPLPEGATATLLVDRGEVLKQGAAAPSWSVSLLGSGNATANTVVPPVSASGSSGGALVARWSGRGPASLVVSGPPADFSRQTDVNMSLNVLLRVDGVPSGQVVLAMDCGPQCRAKLDVTQVLRSVGGKGWTTVSVPLACFKAAGADMAAVSTPFELTSAGRLAVRLGSIGIGYRKGPRSCAATPAM